MNGGPYLFKQGEQFKCALCNRFFGSTHALFAHCRQTTYHEWCERCFLVLPTQKDKEEHIWDSSRHNTCMRCEAQPDFESRELLENHIDGKHGIKSFCMICGAWFENENNLHMHAQTHEPDDIQCYGCHLTFKTFSGMLIHLESGSCASRMTLPKLNGIACRREQRKDYLNEYVGAGCAYICPSCPAQFGKLSALYQHAEDVELCSKSLNWLGSLAKLERAIAREMALPDQSRPNPNQPRPTSHTPPRVIRTGFISRIF